MLTDQIVMTYALLGDWRQAIDWVERAYARLLRAAVLEDLL